MNAFFPCPFSLSVVQFYCGRCPYSFLFGGAPVGVGACGIGAPCNAYGMGSPRPFKRLCSITPFESTTTSGRDCCTSPVTSSYQSCATIEVSAPPIYTKRHAPSILHIRSIKKIIPNPYSPPLRDGLDFLQRPARNKTTPNKFVMVFSIGAALPQNPCFEPNGLNVISGGRCPQKIRFAFDF